MKEQIKIDFDLLTKYRWDSESATDLPIISIIKFYQASGIYDIIKKNTLEENKQWACIDILGCNFYTMMRIRRFIEDNWKHFNVMIDADEHIFWKNGNKSWHKYERTLSSKISNSIKADFSMFCPSLDDSLEDNIIEINIPEEKTEDKN